MNVALYAGSFDPFTNGHLDVVKEAAKIFDKVYVCCFVNNKKQRSYPMDKMRDSIEACLYREGVHNANAITSNMLTAECARLIGAQYIIRGLRNTSDYLYEEEIAKFNNMLNPELRTIYIRALNDSISSSAVKELLFVGKDIQNYVPIEVAEIIKR